jgi:hypothetical protein
VAYCCVLLLPLALRRRTTVPRERDDAWRDRLPTCLQLTRPLIRWYAASVDEEHARLSTPRVQTQLNMAGATYLLTPTEFIVTQRLACVLGVGLALYVIFVLRVRDPMFSRSRPALRPSHTCTRTSGCVSVRRNVKRNSRRSFRSSSMSSCSE